jgi:pilus assembly protein CpaC
MKNSYPAALLAAMAFAGSAFAATSAMVAAPARAFAGTSSVVTAPARATAAAPALKPCASVVVDPPTVLTLGKSRVIRLDFPAARLIVGGQGSSRAGRAAAPGGTAPAGAAGPAPAGGPQASDGVADTEITLLSPTELFFLGKKTGSMNVVLQSTDGRCVVKDIIVTVDPDTLQAKLTELMPEESGIKVRGADTSLVLTGSVSDSVKLDQVMSVATSYGDAKRIVNLLRINAPQQVMLEVKIAEVSKTLLDRFGLDFSRLVTSADGATSSIISGIIGGGAGTLGRFHPNSTGGAISGAAAGSTGAGAGSAAASMSTVGRGATLLGINATKNDGVIRVLAEPNIMAISGQAASFLSGGKIFIPVAKNTDTGGTTITLEEKEFGVGLKFTPTVLDGGRVNLKLVSEASELSQTGSPFTTVNGVTAILPSMVTRRVDTTVQLGDGQSFVVAGLIKNNVNEAINRFPGLGEVPVMGALFRSTEFQTDQTELMFVVTPRLVKPLTTAVNMPTDNHVVPNRSDIILMGSGEGSAPAPQRAAAIKSAPATAAAEAPTQPAPVVAAPAQAAPAAPVVAAPAQAAPAAPVVAAPVQSAPAVPVVAAPTVTPEPVFAPAVEAEPVASPAPVSTSVIEPAPIAAPEAPMSSAIEAAPVASTAPAAGDSN